MLFAPLSVAGFAFLFTTVSSAPFKLSNGFPIIANPSSQLTATEKQAYGTLPNSPLPASLTPDSMTSLQVIAFNEIFEVAFFTNLIYNITNKVPGYTDIPNKDLVLDTLIAVQAQEELHALDANTALAAFGAQPIQACEYKFPVSDFPSALALSSMFTDVALGFLGDVAGLLATAGDDGLIRTVASIIGQEGEQNGFFRAAQEKVPSALPFLTAGSRDFTYTILNQMFIVNGTCPNSNTINVPVFSPLMVVTQNVQPKTQNLQFSCEAENVNVAQVSAMSLVYVNQQNLPVVEPIQDVSVSGNMVTFQAAFPYDQYLMNGLTFAAVTKTAGPFASADDVASATMFGPGLIEIN